MQVKYAWRLHINYKLRSEIGRFVTKWAVRHVPYRCVPQTLLGRPQVAFDVPLEYYL